MMRTRFPRPNNSHLADMEVAGVSLACVPAAAPAASKPTGNAEMIAKAMLRDNSIYRNASFVNRPKQGFPTAIGTSKLVGFPRDGPHPGRERCRSLGEGWFELKEGPYRLMFFYLTEADRRGVVLTHGFAKHRGPPLEVERQRAARLREQLAFPGPRGLDAD